MENVSSDDFAQLYPWITKEYFEKILRHDQNTDTITVTGYSIKAALAKGENYTSDMLRATVDYNDISHTSQSRSFIIKAAIKNIPDLVHLNAEMKTFEREIITFQLILPQAEKLLQSIGETAAISAKCYDANINLSYLVFDDLSAVGYTNADRRMGLDMIHFKLVLAKAAKWHAATAVLQSKKLLPLITFGSIMHSSTTKMLIVNTIKATADAVLQISGYEYLSTKLRALCETIYQKVLNAAVVNDDDFNVICHGDMWANNIMFRHDGAGNVNDAILVDFQMIFCGSSVLEIIYTFFTSSHADLREADWTVLVQFYHEELVRLLILLKYPKHIPSLAEIQTDLNRRQVYAMPLAILGLALRNFEDVNDDTFSKLLRDTDEDHQFRVKGFLNPKIRNALGFFLSYFDRNGYFD